MKNTLQTILEKKQKLDSFAFDSVKLVPKLSYQLHMQLVFSLNKIEEGELSLAEVTHIVEKNEAIGSKNVEEQSRVKRYSKAAQWVQSTKKSLSDDISEQTIIDMHTLHFLNEERSDLLRYSYKVPYALTEYIEWLHQQSYYSVELVTEAVVQIVRAGFLSEEKRLPRTLFLLCNVLLVGTGYPVMLLKEDKTQQYVSAVESLVKRQHTEEFVSIVEEAILESLNIGIEVLKPSNESDVASLLKIGELAKATHETIPTIRHWTKQGLLKVAAFSEGGYQLYEPGITEVVLKIRELQREQRLSVKEIAERI